jgi:hypothetical protein
VLAEIWGESLDIRSALLFPMVLYLEGTEYLVGNLVVVEDETLLVDKGSWFQVQEVEPTRISRAHQDTRLLVMGGSMEVEGTHAVDRLCMAVEGVDTS